MTIDRSASAEEKVPASNIVPADDSADTDEVRAPTEEKKNDAAPEQSPSSKPEDKTADKPVDKPADKPAEKPAEKPAPMSEDPAEPLVRLRPLMPLPQGVGFEAATVRVESDRSVTLGVNVSGVSKRFRWDGNEIECAGACKAYLPLGKKTEVHPLEIEGETIPMLVIWIDVPASLKSLRVKAGKGATVQIIEDSSGFNPAAYSLLLSPQRRPVALVFQAELSAVTIWPYSYAASETTEWHVVISNESGVVAKHDGEGELPEFITLAEVLKGQVLPEGRYNCRVDIVYASGTHEGQASFLDVDVPEHRWHLSAFTLGGIVLFAGGGTEYFASPFAQWSPRFSPGGDWSFLGHVSFAFLKDSQLESSSLFSQFGLQVERKWGVVRTGFGGGIANWAGTQFSVVPYGQISLIYDWGLFQRPGFRTSLVGSYVVMTLLHLTHGARLGIRFAF